MIQKDKLAKRKSEVQINENTRNIKLVHTMRSNRETLE